MRDLIRNKKPIKFEKEFLEGGILALSALLRLTYIQCNEEESNEMEVLRMKALKNEEIFNYQDPHVKFDIHESF